MQEEAASEEPALALLEHSSPGNSLTLQGNKG